MCGRLPLLDVRLPPPCIHINGLLLPPLALPACRLVQQHGQERHCLPICVWAGRQDHDRRSSCPPAGGKDAPHDCERHGLPNLGCTLRCRLQCNLDYGLLAAVGQLACTRDVVALQLCSPAAWHVTRYLCSHEAHSKLSALQDGLLLAPLGSLGASLLPLLGMGYLLVALVLFTQASLAGWWDSCCGRC